MPTANDLPGFAAKTAAAAQAIKPIATNKYDYVAKQLVDVALMQVLDEGVAIDVALAQAAAQLQQHIDAQ